MIIAIDGPAAAGKGTLARRLAAHFDYAFLDTGRLYRAVGYLVLDAGGDPAKVPGPQNLPTGRHGDVLKNGAPADHGKIRCWGCDARTTAQMECAQCLEIMKERAVKAAFDNWERAFFCSHLCYKEHYHEHKARHGPSKSVPTKTDGTIHHFPCAEGCGALWDSKALRRHVFDECEPYE